MRYTTTNQDQTTEVAKKNDQKPKKRPSLFTRVAASSLESQIRQTANRLLTIDNPLPPGSEVTWPEDWSQAWSCDDQDVRLVKLPEAQG